MDPGVVCLSTSFDALPQNNIFVDFVIVLPEIVVVVIAFVIVLPSIAIDIVAVVFVIFT